jgi:hypothetical protein
MGNIIGKKYKQRYALKHWICDSKQTVILIAQANQPKIEPFNMCRIVEFISCPLISFAQLSTLYSLW